MDLNAIIQEFCEPGIGLHHRSASHDCTLGLSPSGVFSGLQSSLSLPTLLDTRMASLSSLSGVAVGLDADPANAEYMNSCKRLANTPTPAREQPPRGPDAEMLEAFQRLQEDYAQLQEKFYMMEQAARSEISGLRASLVDAHRDLAEIGAAKAVSGCTEKLVARHAAEEVLHTSEQNMLVKRADITRDFDRRLHRALRFGPPEQLVRRVMKCRLEWLQLQCLSVWRALIALKPEPQSLRELELEAQCWEKAWRLRVVSVSARRMFNVWRRLAEQQEKGRLRRLVDLAHDTWGVLQSRVRWSVDRHYSLIVSGIRSRCFLEWLWRYRRSRRLARLWRWFGKERQRQLMRWCFTSFFRAMSESRNAQTRMRELLSAPGLRTVTNAASEMELGRQLFVQKSRCASHSYPYRGVV